MREIGGAFRSRTGLGGFAIRYITALLTRLFGAGNETRTRDPDLGKVVLYQLSYSRISLSITTFIFPLTSKRYVFMSPGTDADTT